MKPPYSVIRPDTISNEDFDAFREIQLRWNIQNGIIDMVAPWNIAEYRQKRGGLINLANSLLAFLFWAFRCLIFQLANRLLANCRVILVPLMDVF
jgi:hypothetical protein